jgi:hypothetical protein
MNNVLCSNDYVLPSLEDKYCQSVWYLRGNQTVVRLSNIFFLVSFTRKAGENKHYNSVFLFFCDLQLEEVIHVSPTNFKRPLFNIISFQFPCFLFSLESRRPFRYAE